MIPPPPELLELVQKGSRFLVTCHERPDGDALGSMLGTARVLEALGKEVVRYCADPAPEKLRWLPGADAIRVRPPRATAPGARFDATFVHDCSDRRLLGEEFPPPAVTGPIVILDHHANTRPFGDILWRDTAASAVGVLVGRLARALGVPIDRALGEALWCSLASDTGWFRYSSTDVETLELARDCVAAGAVPWEFARRTEEEQPVARLRLLREVLGTLELHGTPPDQLAMLHIADEHLHAAAAQPTEADGFVNYARGLEGVEVGALLAVTRHGVRVSLRAKGRCDVGAIAAQLGGGGHRNAAGCTLPGSLDDARTALVAAVLGPSAPPPRPLAPPAPPAPSASPPAR